MINHKGSIAKHDIFHHLLGSATDRNMPQEDLDSTQI
jgi:hypothetical protein